MSKPQEFSIKVQSEDPKKKDKPEGTKPDPPVSSDVKKDGKEGEGEELVCLYFLIPNHMRPNSLTVGRGPAAERSTGNAN